MKFRNDFKPVKQIQFSRGYWFYMKRGLLKKGQLASKINWRVNFAGQAVEFKQDDRS